MKKTKELQELRSGKLLCRAALTAGFALCMMLVWGCFSLVGHAESAAKIISNGGAKVRSSASTSASVVTSYPQDTVITVNGQVQGSDGYTWYEVWADADTVGYIRGDLLQITDGSTPPAVTLKPQASETPQTTPGGTNLPAAQVSQVNPVSATVAKDNSRIRSNASTDGEIIIFAKSGLALTVTGQAASLDNDGKTWYQVTFLDNNVEKTGFIREDCITLSGEVTPYTDPAENPGTDEDPVETPETPVTSEQPEETKAYDTYEQDGKWYVRTPENAAYDIQALLRLNDSVGDLTNTQKRVKSQKIVIVILVFLLIAAAGAIGYLIYKLRDMMDSAYFNAVENETLRRRSAQSGSGRPMQRTDADKRGGAQRPQGQRPAGTSQSQRPAGTPQGQRPAGAPQGQRPAGMSQGQRPAGAPQGQRPAGTPQGQRPAGAPQSQRPVGTPQGQRPAGAPQGQRPAGPQSQGPVKTQPKNFMADEDEFEFEFLNYDGEEEK